MAAVKRHRYDGNDSFDASIKKKGSNSTLLLISLVTLVVGGGVLAATCTCGLGIAFLVYVYQAKQPDGSQPDEFIGSWKGRFLLHGEQLDVVYTFEKSGKLSESQFTPAGHRVSSSSGRWAFQNGQITINFNGGTSETANAVLKNRNTMMDYLIVRHDDRTQIGTRTTFRRQ
jgi:hypothetical protein